MGAEFDSSFLIEHTRWLIVTFNRAHLPGVVLKNQRKPGTRRFYMKGDNILSKWVILWPVRVDQQLIRIDRFSKPPVFEIFWPQEYGEHAKKKRKVDSPHQYVSYSIGEISQSSQTSAVGGRTKTQLLVKHGFPVTDSIAHHTIQSCRPALLRPCISCVLYLCAPLLC